ncbi:MAG: AAA family ATPase [Bacilli bacterium]|nr:AAA family ATPase [Bacilli bacterium]
MRFYLLKMTTNGIKNIEKDLTLTFYSQTISNKLNLRDTNVKSIFGMNGSGKSAIMNSVDIYKKLTTNRYFLTKIENRYLDNLINKKTHTFSCQMIYMMYDEENNNQNMGVFSHSISLCKKNDAYEIEKEVYSKLKKQSKTINGEYEKIFTINHGLLEFNSNIEEKLIKPIQKRTINLLNSASIFALLPNIIKDIRENELKNDSSVSKNTSSILQGVLLGRYLAVFVSEEDQHKNYDIKYEDYVEFVKEMSKNLNDSFEINLDVNFEIVPKGHCVEYEKEIKKLELFIKKFKPSLNSISFEKKPMGDNFKYFLIFNYDNWSVDSEFESTGIKKLKQLFQYFQLVMIGGIVFIDELDANLHDVYLSRLILFFEKYAKGQLCFTSHNLGTMNELKSYKNSIDFITETCEIEQWKKNGNYTPYNQYRSGMIPNSPFNIEDFDFLDVFGDEDTECK